MEFILKSSSLLILFFLAYRFFLRGDTLFNSHRLFLIAGLISSFLLPLIYIPNYVEYEAVAMSMVPIDNFSASEVAVTTNESVDWYSVFIKIYFLGIGCMVLRFIVGLFSIFKIIINHRLKRKDGLYHIVCNRDISPFSFFNVVVYNPDKFNKAELEIVLRHERVHANDWHTLDVLLSELMIILFWFNPFAYFYNQHIKQNLEYLADYKVSKQLEASKNYQKLLLKTGINNYQGLLGNRFYNSLIKKRIVMLQKPRSNKFNSLKYLVMLPVIGIFLMSFNTKTIYIEKTNPPTDFKAAYQDLNVLKYVITQKTSDRQLDEIKEQFKAKNVDITFTDVSRDKNGYLTGIRIDFKSDKAKGDYHMAKDEPIEDILIKYDVEKGNMSIGKNTDSMSQTIKLPTKRVKIHKEGDTIVEERVHIIKNVHRDHSESKSKSNSKTYSYSISDSDSDNVFVLADDDSHYVIVDTIIKTDNKSNVWISKDGAKTMVYSHGNNNDNSKNFHLRHSSDRPILIKDGKVVRGDAHYIEKSKIGNTALIKDDKSLLKYKKSGKDGVVYFNSKPNQAKAYSYSIHNDFDHDNEFEFDTSVKTKSVIAIGNANSYKYAYAHIDKMSSKADLLKNKEVLKKLGIEVNYSKIRRNRDGEITRIKISLEDENGKDMSVNYQNSDGIPNIKYGKNQTGLFANSSK